MRMDWNDCTIASFDKASQYTKFHENLSEKLKPYLEETKTLCDMGCGMALIDIYLSKFVEKITCVDVNEKVLSYAKNNIKEKGIDNIEVILSDFKDIHEYFDTILISFFSYENIEYFSSHCDKLIIIVNNSEKTHIPVSNRRDNNRNLYTSSNLKTLLEKNQLKYNVENISMQFGQPFESKEEIKQYAKFYNKYEEEKDIYNHIMKNIVVGDKVPYYLPHEKQISVFVVQFNKNNSY